MYLAVKSKALTVVSSRGQQLRVVLYNGDAVSLFRTGHHSWFSDARLISSRTTSATTWATKQWSVSSPLIATHIFLIRPPHSDRCPPNLNQLPLGLPILRELHRQRQHRRPLQERRQLLVRSVLRLRARSARIWVWRAGQGTGGVADV